MTESYTPESDNTEQSPDEPQAEATKETNDDTIRLDDGEEVVELNKQDVFELNQFLEHVQIIILEHETRLGAIEAFLAHAFGEAKDEDENKPGLKIVGETGPEQTDAS